jgi:hypothetical protein
MDKRIPIWRSLCCLIAFCAGCATTQEAPEPVIDPDAAMEYLEPGLRPEVLLFPDYLMVEGFELNQHGRIPESELVGAGMKSKFSLTTVRRTFLDQLDSKGWNITLTEIEGRSFRLMAARKLEHIEIRAVQGSGPTEVFILYRPAPAEEP